MATCSIDDNLLHFAYSLHQLAFIIQTKSARFNKGFVGNKYLNIKLSFCFSIRISIQKIFNF